MPLCVRIGSVALEKVKRIEEEGAHHGRMQQSVRSAVFREHADALDGRVAKCKDRPIAGILRGTPQFQFIRTCGQPGFGFDRDPIGRLPLQLDRPVAAVFRGGDVECREIRHQFERRQQQRPGLPRFWRMGDKVDLLLFVPQPSDGTILGGEFDEKMLVLQHHGSTPPSEAEESNDSTRRQLEIMATILHEGTVRWCLSCVAGQTRS